ncbi:hypothetical protein ACWGH8_38900 [Nonomuraea muscovyensis]|uniref:Protein-S-isoprenylcysteine O-methyltransferase Ste14 n=1 Tax=Nonomuraea muscovyensis TaxID=1124761 RepID=A0A7X0C6Y2_9ACTN|nr:hypothetical protein [Nonomuraea muscovyensis]MBB6349678.1 protein-S-isoprenylcysteine O-methyltransferase Ste14 [Nonomuraea muscovyensis]
MSMGYAFVNVLLSLVVAVLLVVGVVLMARGRKEHGSAATLGLWGCVVLLFGLILGVVRSFTLPMIVEMVGTQSVSVVILIENVIQTAVTFTGTGLLIWAVIARRPPARDPRQPAWQSPHPQGPHPQSPQPQSPHPQQQPGWQHPPQPPAGPSY